MYFEMLKFANIFRRPPPSSHQHFRWPPCWIEKYFDGPHRISSLLLIFFDDSPSSHQHFRWPPCCKEKYFDGPNQISSRKHYEKHFLFSLLTFSDTQNIWTAPSNWSKICLDAPHPIGINFFPQHPSFRPRPPIRNFDHSLIYNIQI
jgi:hypothetical protein